jgi:hypothetical protein
MPLTPGEGEGDAEATGAAEDDTAATDGVNTGAGAELATDVALEAELGAIETTVDVGRGETIGAALDEATGDEVTDPPVGAPVPEASGMADEMRIGGWLCAAEDGNGEIPMLTELDVGLALEDTNDEVGVACPAPAVTVTTTVTVAYAISVRMRVMVARLSR